MQNTLYIPIDTTIDNPVECEKLVKRGDTVVLNIKVFNNGSLANLTGQSIDLILKKSDGTAIQKEIDITNISGGVVTATLSIQATVIAGEVSGELQLSDSNGQNSTNTFTFNVSTSVADNVIEISKNDINILNELRQLIANGEAVIAEYEEHILAIANSIEAIEALVNIKNYIDTNLAALENNNAQAVVNTNNLKVENDKAPGLTISLKSQNDAATSNISTLTTKNQEAVANKNNIDSSISVANTSKIALDTLNTTATNTKNALNTVNQTGQVLLNSLEEFEQEHADVTDISNQLANVNTQLSDIVTVSVKQFGAIGDGVADDTSSIQKAIDAVKNTGGVIFFPRGIYAISKPLEVNTDENAVLLHNIVLKGMDGSIPYYDSYGENPKKLAMGSNIIALSNFSGEALARIGNCNNSLIENLAFRGTLNKTDNRNINGVVYKNSVNNNSIRYCTFYNLLTGIDAYNCQIIKVEFTNVQYCKYIGIRLRGDSRIIGCEISGCGMQLTGAAGELQSTTIFEPGNDYYGGTGILVIDSGGNTNIINCLIDWNCKGIVSDSASGLMVNGCRFHHNAELSMWIRSRGASLGSCGFNIVGNKFLGGGCIVGTLGGNAQISIVNESVTLNPIYGNISSNVFRVGDWMATEDSDNLIATPTATTGPKNSSILVTTNCNVDLTVSGNDMINCATANGSVGVTQSDSSKLTKIKFYGNNTKSVGWTSGNVRIYTSFDKPRISGIPTYIGISGETTENASADPYAWNNYIYSTASNLWIGINQRNVKYDTTANRPSMNGYSDRGYRYYDTTLNKLIMWDGSIWRDSNGSSI